MKRLLIALFSIAILWQPLTGNAQETKVKTKGPDGKEMKMKQKGKMNDALQIDYPYKAEYSSQFEAGDPAHGKLILDMWKAWDDNDLDRQQNFIADTVVLFLPSGDVVRGKEGFMSSAKEYRGMFSSVKSNVEVWIPLKSVDQNENWVAIWGREEDTDKDGKVSTNLIHEIWRVNKDGKIDFMRQYTAAMPKQ
jgi:hypothetical protein